MEPTNGMMNCSLRDAEIISSGDTCSFTCNTGHELTVSESGTRTCQSNGMWTNSDAVCRGKQLLVCVQMTY